MTWETEEREEKKVMLSASLLAAQPATKVVTVTPEEIAMVAGFAAIGVGTLVICIMIWFLLQVIADWKIFTKAGEAGWKCLIPFYNVIVEYGLSWNTRVGWVYMILNAVSYLVSYEQDATRMSARVVLGMILGIIVLVLHIIQSLKLSRSFGKGVGFGIVLILFGPIGRIILGFGSSSYMGPQ